MCLVRSNPHPFHVLARPNEIALYRFLAPLREPTGAKLTLLPSLGLRYLCSETNFGVSGKGGGSSEPGMEPACIPSFGADIAFEALLSVT